MWVNSRGLGNIPSDPDQKRAQFEADALPSMRALYNTALRLARNPDDAADLVQETYLRAYRTFDRFRTGTNCRAWLFTILYSVFINRWRKARREAGAYPLDELEQRFHAFLEASGAALDESWPPEIDAALNALPESFRSAVLLVDVEEFSHQEAAQALRCPVGTLRTRLFRGRRLLFSALQDYARRTGHVRPAKP